MYLPRKQWLSGICGSQDITQLAQYFPGKENMIADQKFREMRDCSNWQLNRQVFLKILLSISHHGCQPICLATDIPVTEVLQLEARPCSKKPQMPSNRTGSAIPTHFGTLLDKSSQWWRTRQWTWFWSPQSGHPNRGTRNSSAFWGRTHWESLLSRTWCRSLRRASNQK